MLTPDIANLPLPELCDLLVTNTTELLKMINEKSPDGYLLRDKKRDVELIQSAIAEKKGQKNPGGSFPGLLA